MWITRNGGPLFNKGLSSASITSEYPLHADIARFFVNRGRNFGLSVDILSSTFERTYEIATSGEVLLFGGGKDSRLLLGSLLETERRVRPIGANGREWGGDLEDLLYYEAPNSSMPNRIVPGIMLRPSIIYHGSGLGEVHLTSPWQQYYDISSPIALKETSDLFATIGWDIKFQAPQSVLPYNITQNILAERYPSLYRNQKSVRRNGMSDKNLHISLIKKYHGISHESHCDMNTFKALLERFVSRSLGQELAAEGKRFGYLGHREVIELEMRTLISRLSKKGYLEDMSPSLPIDQWDADWIDYIHLYVNPSVDSDLLAIYRDYADVFCPTMSTNNLPRSLAKLIAYASH